MCPIQAFRCANLLLPLQKEPLKRVTTAEVHWVHRLKDHLEGEVVGEGPHHEAENWEDDRRVLELRDRPEPHLDQTEDPAPECARVPEEPELGSAALNEHGVEHFLPKRCG